MKAEYTKCIDCLTPIWNYEIMGRGLCEKCFIKKLKLADSFRKYFDRIENQNKGKQMEKQPHPLVNKIDSKHYNEDVTPGEKTTIEKFEEKYTIRQLYDFAMITEDKYFERMGRKDDIDKEERKMASYARYKTMLLNIISKYPTLADMTAKTAYGHLDYEWIY